MRSGRFPSKCLLLSACWCGEGLDPFWGGRTKGCAWEGGGVVGVPFPDNPPPHLQGLRDGDLRRADGDPPMGRRGRLGGRGGHERHPNKYVAQNDPHNALIFLRYVSWGKLFEKNILPGRFATQVVSHL